MIRNRLKSNTRKNLSLKRAEKKAIALIQVAEASYSSISSGDVRCEQAKDYAKRLADLNKKKQQLVKQMVELSKDLKEYQVFFHSLKLVKDKINKRGNNKLRKILYL